MVDFDNYLNVQGIDNLPLLRNLDPRVTHVSIYDTRPNVIQSARLPSHVTQLFLENVALSGPVAFTEGLRYLHLEKVKSKVPIGEWQLPASLETIFIEKCKFTTIDLSRSQIKELVLLKQRTDSDKISLPESLIHLDLRMHWRQMLPLIPAGLKEFVLTGRVPINDFSPVKAAKITSLTIDRAVPFYEYFPDLVRLRYIGNRQEPCEISLTHLTYLCFGGMITEPIELNVPNLEEISFEYTGRVPLRGNFADEVRTMTLKGATPFPDEQEWPSLEELILENTWEKSVADLPRLPWLRWLTLDTPVLTNGVMVSNLREYKEAWGTTRRVKRPQNDRV